MHITEYLGKIEGLKANQLLYCYAEFCCVNIFCGNFQRPAKASNIAIVPDEMWRAQKSENSSSVCHGSGKLYDNMILNNDDEISLPSSSPDGQFSNRSKLPFTIHGFLLSCPFYIA